MGGADTTRENWQTLRRLAADLFARLQRERPGWEFKDLREHLRLPDSGLFQQLAKEAGFGFEDTLSAADQNTILRTILHGVFIPEQIAQETKLPLPQVREFLRQVGVPFGAGGYGTFPWSDPRGEDNQEPTQKVQLRKVSRKGQFSYKGRIYGLGSRYGGRICLVSEFDDHLVLRFADRPQVTLRKT